MYNLAGSARYVKQLQCEHSIHSRFIIGYPPAQLATIGGERWAEKI
jgi:hypothetical protein